MALETCTCGSYQAERHWVPDSQEPYWIDMATLPRPGFRDDMAAEVREATSEEQRQALARSEFQGVPEEVLADAPQEGDQCHACPHTRADHPQGNTRAPCSLCPCRAFSEGPAWDVLRDSVDALAEPPGDFIRRVVRSLAEAPRDLCAACSHPRSEHRPPGRERISHGACQVEDVDDEPRPVPCRCRAFVEPVPG